MSQRNLEITVQGLNGLLCSNVAYSDPLGDYAKYKQFFTDKKGKAKTDGVHRAVRVLDWLLSGYWIDEGKVNVDEGENTVDFEGFSRPYMPSANFQKCLRNAATKWKLGKDVLRSVVVTNDPIIEYKGSKDALEMYTTNQEKFSNTAFTKRGVWVQRLLFPDWQCTFDVLVDDEILSVSQLNRIITMAGKAEGLGTWRPRFGRFDSTPLTVRKDDTKS